eukprot:6426962-Pyramimonas_sp.AAC.1
MPPNEYGGGGEGHGSGVFRAFDTGTTMFAYLLDENSHYLWNTCDQRRDSQGDPDHADAEPPELGDIPRQFRHWPGNAILETLPR